MPIVPLDRFHYYTVRNFAAWSAGLFPAITRSLYTTFWSSRIDVQARSQSRYTQSGFFSQSQRRDLSGQDCGGLWRSALHLPGVSGEDPASGGCPAGQGVRPRRQGGLHLSQHAGPARGALCRADDRCGAGLCQYPAFRVGISVHYRSFRCQSRFCR